MAKLNMVKYKRVSDRKIFANKCICVLSQWPFFEAFESFLFFLYKRQLMGPHDVPLERFVSHFLLDIPFPSPERPRILVQLSAEEKVALFNPEELHLPRSGANFRNMLKTLGPDNCLQLLLMILTEQKIMIHSLRPDVLTSVTEALMQIIFPLHWQYTYIPLLPVSMSGFLESPQSFLFGLDSKFFDVYDPPEDVSAVDLDTNTVTICLEKRNEDMTAKLMPKKACKTLKTTLEALLDKCTAHQKLARQMEATNDGAIDFVFRVKRQELELDMEIRDAFLHFMVQILTGYGKFLQPITSAPSVDATDCDKLFDQIGFLRSKDRKYLKFYTTLVKTQMFVKFIEERSFVSDTNTALAFFDECIARWDQESSLPNGGATESLKFLELENFDSDTTVLTMPPDAADLPKGSVYKYEKFENLNSDLFKISATIDGTSAQPNNCHTPQNHKMSSNSSGQACTPPTAAETAAEMFATPSSVTMSKRTKYEIRSALKSARKNAQDPVTWTLCLLSTAYSLWFIHLPGFVLSNKSREIHTLRLGLLCIQRMQRRLRLRGSAHIDEICYRVMMQLCGVYGQPALAVQVLNELKRSNEIPNAVTYGYYNKAVLECAWPGNQEETKGARAWRLLRQAISACAILNDLRRSEVKGAFLASVRQYETVRAAGSKQGHYDNVSMRSSQDQVSSASDNDSLKGNDAVAKDEETRPVAETAISNHISEEMSAKNEVEVSSVAPPSNSHNISAVAEASEAVTEVPTRVRPQSIVKPSNSDLTPNPVADVKADGSPEGGGVKKVNRALFTDEEAEEEFDEWQRTNSCSTSTKSRSVSVESDEGMVMAPAIGIPTAPSLPTVHEDETPLNSSLLSPLVSPSSVGSGGVGMEGAGGMQRVRSTASMTVPVTENDPLGALTPPANHQSPTNKGLVKSATCPNNDLYNVGNNRAKTPVKTGPTINSKQLDDHEILGSPFSTDMTRSSTMPLQPTTPSIGGLIKSKLSKPNWNNWKKSISTSVTSSPAVAKIKPSTEVLSQGLTNIRSAATTLSKRVGEKVSEYHTPLKTGMGTPYGGSSYGLNSTDTHDGLAGMVGDEASVVNSITMGTAADQGTWSEFTGQLWDKYFWGGEQVNKSNSLPRGGCETVVGPKVMFEAFEEFYSNLPKDVTHSIALEIVMTSCSMCRYCSTVLYDEEIMAGWSADDSSFNTKCRFCSKEVVPLLTVFARSEDTKVTSDDPITVPYLSPLVLRKELENVLETEGDTCLADPGMVDDNARRIIYWNLVWFYERVAVKSHLPALCFRSKSLFNDTPDTGDGEDADDRFAGLDHNNVKVTCLWDNVRFHDGSSSSTSSPAGSSGDRGVGLQGRGPIYTHWVRPKNQQTERITEEYLNKIVNQQPDTDMKPLIKQIIFGVSQNDLTKPVKSMLEERFKEPPTTMSPEASDASPTLQKNGSKGGSAVVIYRSVYREILFLTLTALGQNIIDLTALDRVVKEAFENLPDNFKEVAQKADFAPDRQVSFCRKIFRELTI